MSAEEDYISYVFAWHSLSDACPKCRSLNGQEFRDQSIFQNTVFSVIWGDIWDLDASHTLAHPNCRCQLEVRVDIDIKKWEPYNTLKEIVGKWSK